MRFEILSFEFVDNQLKSYRFVFYSSCPGHVEIQFRNTKYGKGLDLEFCKFENGKIIRIPQIFQKELSPEAENYINRIIKLLPFT